MHRMLLPLLDLINHGDAERANLDIMQAENGDFYAYALRDIAAGEEVRAAARVLQSPFRIGSARLADHGLPSPHSTSCTHALTTLSCASDGSRFRCHARRLLRVDTWGLGLQSRTECIVLDALHSWCTRTAPRCRGTTRRCSTTASSSRMTRPSWRRRTCRAATCTTSPSTRRRTTVRIFHLQLIACPRKS